MTAGTLPVKTYTRSTKCTRNTNGAIMETYFRRILVTENRPKTRCQIFHNMVFVAKMNLRLRNYHNFYCVLYTTIMISMKFCFQNEQLKPDLGLSGVRYLTLWLSCAKNLSWKQMVKKKLSLTNKLNCVAKQKKHNNMRYKVNKKYLQAKIYC